MSVQLYRMVSVNFFIFYSHHNMSRIRTSSRDCINKSIAELYRILTIHSSIWEPFKNYTRNWRCWMCRNYWKSVRWFWISIKNVLLVGCNGNTRFMYFCISFIWWRRSFSKPWFDRTYTSLLRYSSVTSLWQYLKDRLQSFLCSFHGIRNFCNDIQVDNQDDAFEAFGRWVRHVYTDQSCFDLDYVARQWQSQQVEWEFVDEFAWNSSFDRSFPFDIRPQWYQKCTQLGLFPTTVNGQTLFGRLIQQEYYYLFCSRAFYDGR